MDIACRKSVMDVEYRNIVMGIGYRMGIEIDTISTNEKPIQYDFFQVILDAVVVILVVYTSTRSDEYQISDIGRESSSLRYWHLLNQVDTKHAWERELFIRLTYICVTCLIKWQRMEEESYPPPPTPPPTQQSVPVSRHLSMRPLPKEASQIEVSY